LERDYFEDITMTNDKGMWVVDISLLDISSYIIRFWYVIPTYMNDFDVPNIRYSCG
jgi:hypothetical protein